MKRCTAFLLVLTMALCCSPLPVFARTVTPSPSPAYIQPGGSAGMPFPEFNSYDLDMNPVDDSVFGEADRTVVVLWSDTCPSCLMELRDFQALSERYSASSSPSIRVLGIAFGDRDRIVQLLDIYDIDFMHITFSQYAAYVNFSRILYYNENDCAPIPQTFLVDRNGIISAHVWGSFSGFEELEHFALSGGGEAGLPGDADGSGVIDTTDALTVLRCALGIAGDPDEFLALCDMDGNKRIDTTDSLIILRMALGIAR